MTLLEAANLLTGSIGSLVYHLTLAMALAVMFSVGQVYKKQDAHSLSQRWITASASLLLLQIMLIVVAGLPRLGFDGIDLLVPTLNRFVSFVGILVFLWVCNLPRENLSNIALLAGLVLGLLGLILSPFLLQLEGTPTPFNHTVVDAGWSFAGLAVILTAVIGLISSKPYSWDLSFVPFSLLLVGALLHISKGPPNGSLAGFMRMAELAAYPLFAILGARLMAQESLRESAPDFSLDFPAQSSTLSSLLNTLSQLASLSAVRDQNDLLERAVEAIGREMRAHLCFLFGPEDEAGTIPLSKGYDLIREEFFPSIAIDCDNCPEISESLKKPGGTVFEESEAVPDLQFLSGLLKVKLLGPALLTPLQANNHVFGGIMLVSPYSDHDWSEEQRETMEIVADFLAKRLLLFPTQPEFQGDPHQAAPSPTQQQIRLLETENRRLKEALEILQTGEGKSQATEESKVLAKAKEKAEQTDTELKLALKEVAELRSELADLKSSPSPAPSPEESPPDFQTIVSLAQELRQPTSSILGYTDLLLGESVGLLGAMQQQFLNRVRDATHRIRDLLNQLLETAVGEGESISLMPPPTEVIRCLEEAVTQISEQQREKAITLRMDFPEDLPAVLAEEEAIVQIFYHLFENAIGVSPQEAEVKVSASVRETDAARYLMIAVSDAGPGIPPDDLGRVFQRAYRTDQAIIQGIADKGTGLMTVKGLCDMLDGRIWVDSEVGTGSTFSVLLPLAGE